MNQNNNPEDEQHDNNVKYALYCGALEDQYEKAKEEGVFEVLKLFELDKDHSDDNLVQAVDYYNSKDGVVGNDAPIDFLTAREKTMVNRDSKFRPHLYCMLLSHRLSEAIQNKSVFMKHSFKYAFDG